MCGGGGDLWDVVTSVATGGASDVVQGDAPGTAVIEQILPPSISEPLNQFTQSVFTGGISDAVHAYDDGGNLFDFIDRGIDPGGIVDLGTREVGELLPEELRKIAPALGSIIGSVIYPVAGTGAGYGVGSKLAGQGAEEGMKGAATAAALAYLASAASQAVSSINAPAPDISMGGYDSAPLTDPNFYSMEVPAIDPVTGGQNTPYGYEPALNESGVMSNAEIAAADTSMGGYDTAPLLENQGFDPVTWETPMPTGDPYSGYGPSSLEKWLDAANKVAKLLSGSTTTGDQIFGTVRETFPGQSPDMTILAEMMSNGGSTKPSKITSGEIPLSNFYETQVPRNEIKKYNEQQLYYA